MNLPDIFRISNTNYGFQYRLGARKCEIAQLLDAPSIFSQPTLSVSMFLKHARRFSSVTKYCVMIEWVVSKGEKYPNLLSGGDGVVGVKTGFPWHAWRVGGGAQGAT